MKYIGFLLLYNVVFNSYCQDFDSNDWVLLENEDVVYHNVSKSEVYIVKDLTIEFVWDEKLSKDKYSKNLGGIKSMTLYKNQKLVNTIQNIEDRLELGEVYFQFYDFNLDGELDFSIPINSSWKQYYLFNSKDNLYEHIKEWDYIKIQRLNKTKKQILLQPDGIFSKEKQKLHQVKGTEIREINY